MDGLGRREGIRFVLEGDRPEKWLGLALHFDKYFKLAMELFPVILKRFSLLIFNQVLKLLTHPRNDVNQLEWDA